VLIVAAPAGRPHPAAVEPVGGGAAV